MCEIDCDINFDDVLLDKYNCHWLATTRIALCVNTGDSCYFSVRMQELLLLRESLIYGENHF